MHADTDGGTSPDSLVEAVDAAKAANTNEAPGVDIMSPRAALRGRTPSGQAEYDAAARDVARTLAGDLRALEQGLGLAEGAQPLADSVLHLQSAVAGNVEALSALAGVPAGTAVIDGIMELVTKVEASARDRADLVKLSSDVQSAVTTARRAAQQVQRPAAGGIDAQAFKSSMQKVSTTFSRLRNALTVLAKSHDDLVAEVGRIASLVRAAPGSQPDANSSLATELNGLVRRLSRMELAMRDGPPFDSEV